MDTDEDNGRTDGPSPDASTADPQPAELDMPSAAAALGISPDALRKRIARGSIPARKVAGVWMVTLDPRPPGRTDTDASPGRSAVRPRPSVMAIDPADYARAQERIVGLVAQLTQAQADRDRWHEQAATVQETYLRDMAAMRELVAREQAIALRATTDPDARTDTGRTDADVAADGHEATVQEAVPAHEQRAGNDAPDTPSADRLPPRWRRWWRRLTGTT